MYVNKFTVIGLAALGAGGVWGKCDKVLQQTIDTCIARIQIDINQCLPTDQSCICLAKFNTMDCYNVCAEDAEVEGRRKIKESEVLGHCGAAGISTRSIYPSATKVWDATASLAAASASGQPTAGPPSSPGGSSDGRKKVNGTSPSSASSPNSASTLATTSSLILALSGFIALANSSSG